MLLTDGTIYRNCVEFATKDETLRDLFSFLSKINGAKRIFCKRVNGIYKVYFFDKTIIRKLKKISPSYKTAPSRNQSKEDYLKESQPTLKKFFKLPKKVIIECIRIAMSCDGNISVRISPKSTKIKLRPELTLNCGHPILVKEWKKLFSLVGIEMKIQKNRGVWGGFRGVSTEDKSEIEKFYKLGGFIKNVRVSGKSKRFKGIEKNKILKKCLHISYVKNLKNLIKITNGPVRS